jgi:hypothetical protein
MGKSDTNNFSGRTSLSVSFFIHSVCFILHYNIFPTFHEKALGGKQDTGEIR